jgi:hypothetical protein
VDEQYLQRELELEMELVQAQQLEPGSVLAWSAGEG